MGCRLKCVEFDLSSVHTTSSLPVKGAQDAWTFLLSQDASHRQRNVDAKGSLSQRDCIRAGRVRCQRPKRADSLVYEKAWCQRTTSSKPASSESAMPSSVLTACTLSTRYALGSDVETRTCMGIYVKTQCREISRIAMSTARYMVRACRHDLETDYGAYLAPNGFFTVNV